MKQPIVGLTLMLAAVVACGQTGSPHGGSSAQTADADAVYAAVLPSVSTLPRYEFLISHNTVPYAETAHGYPVDPANFITREQFKAKSDGASREERMRLERRPPCIDVPEAERESYVSAMKDYREKNSSSFELQPTFVLPKPYRLLSSDEEKQAETDNPGIFKVSAVGFSSDGNTAIVYVGFDCFMCGRWALYVLKRVDGQWEKLPAPCHWVS